MRRLLAVSLAALAVAAGAGCGNKQGIVQSADNEGIYVDVGPLVYQVQISRYLNPADPEDRTYLKGVPTGVAPGPKETWFAVFMRVQNYTKQPQTPTGDFEITDTQRNLYRPVPLDANANPFAYTTAPLGPGAVLPLADTVAFNSPTQGALLLFKIKIESIQNRPLEMRISGANQSAVINLDV